MKTFSLLVMSLVLGAASLHAAEVRKLTFNPPDTTIFTIQSTSVRELWLDSIRMSTDSTFSTLAATMEKVDSGYRLVTDQKSYAGKKNGIPFHEELIKLMTGLKVTLSIAPNGEATGITGFEDMFDRVDQIASPKAAKVLKDELSPRLMSDKIINDWNNRMADIVGRTFALNALKYTAEPLTLPDETRLIAFQVSYISDTVRINGKLHVKIRSISDTNPNRLARQLGRDVKFVADLFKYSEADMAALASAGSHYQLVQEFVVDASTLLVGSEHSRREMVGKQVDAPGQRIMSRIVETTDRQYTYTRR